MLSIEEIKELEYFKNALLAKKEDLEKMNKVIESEYQSFGEKIAVRLKQLFIFNTKEGIKFNSGHCDLRLEIQTSCINNNSSFSFLYLMPLGGRSYTFNVVVYNSLLKDTKIECNDKFNHKQFNMLMDKKEMILELLDKLIERRYFDELKKIQTELTNISKTLEIIN